MSKPKVSVIIPNYNHASFLQERIDSVLNQTYTDYELIILDDCSTDNSLDVIRQYENNPHLSAIVVNKDNSGSPFIQWNKGFQIAKGELIWIAESDDSCDATFLEKLVAEFEKDPNLSFAFTRSLKMDENGNKTSVLQPMFTQDVHMDGKHFITKYLIWGNKVWNASSVLFRKNNALALDKEYMSYKGAGDWLFWVEMSEKGNVVVKSSPLNHYRIYDGNTTLKMRLSGLEDNEDIKLYSYFKKRGYLSVIDNLRIRKKYIMNIKYFNEYSSDSIRLASLQLWNPSLLDKFLSEISYRLNK